MGPIKKPIKIAIIQKVALFSFTNNAIVKKNKKAKQPKILIFEPTLSSKKPKVKQPKSPDKLIKIPKKITSFSENFKIVIA